LKVSVICASVSASHVALATVGKDGSLIRDTWNTDVIEELQPQPGDVVVYKHRFSGFYQTKLHDILGQTSD
jgi:nicotinamidase-related amidase